MNKEESILPASDFLETADIRGNYLYRKDGYIMCYLRIYPYNLALKSREERKAETDKLTAKFQDDRKDFTYFSLPREIDLDGYKNYLKEKHSNELNIGRRHLLAHMMVRCAYLSTNGENYEHQHFIRIWKKNKEKEKAEEELLERITEFMIRYKESGIDCEILDEKEITKVCNLFGNSLQAGFENVDESTLYTPIMQLD